MIYLNNAATTWPKPEPVCKAIDDAVRHMSSPTRTHSAEGADTANAMEDARATIASFLGIDNPSRFAMMPGCTYATNAAIQGLDWQHGDAAIISGLEHHASSRAIRLVAERRDITFHVSPYQVGRPLDLEYIETKLKDGNVRVVICTMAANVTGEILPYAELTALCKRYETPVLLDAAQSAGIIDFRVRDLDPELMVFAGHKGMYGPTGIGGLYVKEGFRLAPFAVGGTGKDSGRHPMSGKMPSEFEVGTHNAIGIAGLAAGVKWLEENGVAKVRQHEMALTKRFIEGLDDVPGAHVYGVKDCEQKVAVVSCNFGERDPKQVAAYLSEQHEVATRAGYHCSPLAHESIGTLPGPGTIRFGFGYFNTEDEVDQVLSHLKAMQTAAV
ncbi:MAG: aminotransferase class V-fold PLP-dependent enzyme [Phycisphaerales bacterium JB063]